MDDITKKWIDNLGNKINIELNENKKSIVAIVYNKIEKEIQQKLFNIDIDISNISMDINSIHKKTDIKEDKINLLNAKNITDKLSTNITEIKKELKKVSDILLKLSKDTRTITN